MFENYTPDKNLYPSDPRFGVGPSLVSPEIIQALADTKTSLMGTSHRKPALKNLVKEIQEGLTTYFKLPKDYEILLGNGGATMLFDMVGLGLCEKKSNHFTCGEFSNKWYKSHELIPWIEAKEIAAEYGQGITPTTNGSADTYCMTLNETSTGVIIDSIPEATDKEIICVDATSGGAQTPCDLGKTDFYFFSPQKVFASDGGLFVGIASPKAIERALKIDQDKNRYIPGFMNFKTAIDNSRKNQTYTTPAVATLFMLNEQIKRLNLAGYDNVIADGQKKAELLYGWASEKAYLNPYIKEEKYRSNVVATIDIDDKYDSSAITKRLRELNFALDIDAYRKLGRNQLRISMFYNVKYADLEKLTSAISQMIEQA